jgi:pimeloyl-ACP methyl ester carboxylesterase
VSASLGSLADSLDAVAHLPQRYVPQRLVVPPWLPAAEVRLLPDRGEVFYRRHDSGRADEPTLLLLHGWTASADLQWFTAYRALAERYSFVAIDHRGHGRGLRSDEAFTLEDAADDAAALVRELGIGPVVVVGYSMGGPISLLLSRRHPDLVSGMVLEATALEWRSTVGDWLTWRSLVFLEAFLRSRASRWFGRRAIRHLADWNHDLEPYLGWILAESRRGDAADIADAGRALSRYDARPFASSIRLPSAVVFTTQDHLVKASKQRALACAVDARVIELAGDHFAFWANAKEFADATREAVDDVVSRLPVASPAR